MRRTSVRRIVRLWIGAAIASFLVLPARGQVGPKTILDQVGFDQKLDGQIPLDATFRDESGHPVRLGDLLRDRPAILTLVYYRCPMLCNQALNGLARSLRPLSLSVGKDFDIITVSINPDEKPDLASAKKSAYLEQYDRAGADQGWHFLTGEKPQIERLAQAVGFRYTYNPNSGLYAHAAGLALLTSKGRIARYYYGIDYPARDLQFGLMEASAGRIGSPIAKVLLLCYDYDAASGKYTLAILRLARVLGMATVLALATYMVVMFRRDRRQALAASTPEPAPAD